MVNIREYLEAIGGAMRRARRGVLAALLILPLAAVTAHADADPSNDTDTVVITITPLIDIGVAIDTASVNLALTMAMGAIDYIVKPATLTVLGTFQVTEIDVAGANVSPSPVWTLDVDETAAQDQVQVYMLFSEGRDNVPSEAEFAGAKNLVTGAAKRAGQFAGTAADQNFENNSMSGGADMDNLVPGDERQIWFRIDTPPITSTSQDQAIQITFTATKDNI